MKAFLVLFALALATFLQKARAPPVYERRDEGWSVSLWARLLGLTEDQQAWLGLLDGEKQRRRL